MGRERVVSDSCLSLRMYTYLLRRTGTLSKSLWFQKDVKGCACVYLETSRNLLHKGFFKHSLQKLIIQLLQRFVGLNYYIFKMSCPLIRREIFICTFSQEGSLDHRKELITILGKKMPVCALTDWLEVLGAIKTICIILRHYGTETDVLGFDYTSILSMWDLLNSYWNWTTSCA